MKNSCHGDTDSGLIKDYEKCKMLYFLGHTTGIITIFRLQDEPPLSQCCDFVLYFSLFFHFHFSDTFKTLAAHSMTFIFSKIYC